MHTRLFFPSSCDRVPTDRGSESQAPFCTEGKSLMKMLNTDLEEEEEVPRGEAFMQADGESALLLRSLKAV